MGAHNSKQKPNAYLRANYQHNYQHNKQQSNAHQRDNQYNGQLPGTQDIETYDDEDNHSDLDDETILFGITPGDDMEQLPAQQDYEGNDNNNSQNEIYYQEEGGITLMGFMDNNISFNMMFNEGIVNIDNDQQAIDDDEGDKKTQQEIDIDHDEKDEEYKENENDTLQKGIVLIDTIQIDCDINGEHDNTEQNKQNEHDQSKKHVDEAKVDEKADEIQTTFDDKKDDDFIQEKRDQIDINLSLNPNADQFIPNNNKKCGGQLITIHEDEPLRISDSSKNNDDRCNHIKLINLSDINGNKYKNNTHNTHNTHNAHNIHKIKANIEYSAYKDQYSTVKISKQLTNEISDRISDEIPHLYNHMIKSIALQQKNEFVVDNEPDPIKIFNYDFHDKMTNEPLYFVAKPCTQHRYKWSMMETLFTADAIENEFGILNKQLPKLWRLQPQFQQQLNHQQKVKNFVENEIDIQKLCSRTKWNKPDKITIYNKQNNADRTTLSLTKQEFVKQFNEFIISNEYKNNDLIPIIMPNQTENDNYDHHIEFVQIVRLKKTDIFVSYKYDEVIKNIKVCGIHLDPEFIASQNRLLFPHHKQTKHHFLKDFRSNIDYLTIGNPDLLQNQLNYYENRCDKLTKFIKNSQEYFLKILSNAANITINNIEAWIDKSSIVCKNSKNADYLLDLSNLLDINQAANVQTASILQNSPLYIQHLQEINNYYFQQTLNPIPLPIIPHPMHKQTVATNNVTK